MSEIFFENPLMIGVIGGIFSAIAAFVWVQLGQKQVLYMALGLAIVTVLLVMVNIQVKTDREEIREIMGEIASAIRTNDHNKVYSYLHPNAEVGLERVKQELPRYKFDDARITVVHDISVDESTPPPTAITEFNVVVNVEEFGRNIPRFVKVYFMKRDQRWMVRDYEHFDATLGFKKRL